MIFYLRQPLVVTYRQPPPSCLETLMATGTSTTTNINSRVARATELLLKLAAPSTQLHSSLKKLIATAKTYSYVACAAELLHKMSAPPHVAVSPNPHPYLASSLIHERTNMTSGCGRVIFSRTLERKAKVPTGSRGVCAAEFLPKRKNITSGYGPVISDQILQMSLSRAKEKEWLPLSVARLRHTNRYPSI